MALPLYTILSGFSLSISLYCLSISSLFISFCFPASLIKAMIFLNPEPLPPSAAFPVSLPRISMNFVPREANSILVSSVRCLNCSGKAQITWWPFFLSNSPIAKKGSISPRVPIDTKIIFIFPLFLHLMNLRPQ